MKAYLISLLKYRYLLEDLVAKDFKLKYRRSVLGVLWSVLNPLLMLGIITVVFSTMFKADIQNFPVYYLCGHLVFNFVIEGTNGALMSIVQAGYLIKKVYIPKFIFPLEKCSFALINTLFSFIALLIIIPITGCPLHFSVFLIFIPILNSYLFSVGIGLILSTLNTFFRDMGHIYMVITTAWMYLTPLFYPESILKGPAKVLLHLNPLYYFTDYVRELVLNGRIPDFEITVLNFSISIFFLSIGIFIFRKYQDKFILYV